MNNYIDIYCERLEPGLWAEPINAATNAAFFIAAFFAWRLAKGDFYVQFLAFLILCIGIGSTLFHTFATPLTQMADVIPILLFQISFLWLYSLRVMKLSIVKTAGLFVLFLVSSVLCDQIPSWFLNGSAGYLPALVFVAGFGVWHYKQAAQERFVLLLAAGVFVVSLTFRSMDMVVCESVQIGTHFLWHCLNGVVLYLCVRGYVAGRKISPN